MSRPLTSSEIRYIIERQLPTHKCRLELLRTTRKTYAYLCNGCGLFQFFNKTGVRRVVTVPHARFRKKYVHNFEWTEAISAWCELFSWEGVHNFFGQDASSPRYNYDGKMVRR